MSIVFDNVSYIYEKKLPWEKRALNGIDLRVEKGEILGVIGPTGSGKSTLLQLMNGILLPTEGRVLVDEEDTYRVKGRRLTRLRQKVGLVFQFPEDQLFENRVYKDVAFGPRAIGLPLNEVDERVRWAMEVMQLDFDELGERSPLTLSGGQKRRAAIAGVLALKPEYLVLDEPGAGLDVDGRKTLLSIIKELSSRQGMGIVLVSHLLRDIFAVCDRVIVLRDGQVVADDLPGHIVGNEMLLNSCGLRVPPINRLLHDLKTYFRDINTEAIGLSAAVEEVARAMEGSR